MAHVSINDVNAWLQETKLDLTELDIHLEEQIAVQVFAKLGQVFDVTGWTTESATPKLIQNIIAMYYAGWLYDLHYADEAENNSYANRLRRGADLAIEGLLEGTQFLEEVPVVVSEGNPSFFPNDVSSATEPTAEFPHNGGPYFLIGQVF